jgi:2-dehydropantoate 2-reductase
MRILILGAGGIGGYYGGRLAAAGVDVTFLVRPKRAAQLAANGLVITSPMGDLTVPQVKTVTADAPGTGYDAIIVACKAYDLEAAIASIKPAAAGAQIIAQLNGMRHLDRLDAEFGAANVLGGVAMIGVTMEPDGTIRHLNKIHGFVFGARQPSQAAFCAALAPVIALGGFESRNSETIIQDMWEKWVFLATTAAMSCLFRGTIGQIISATPEGGALVLEALADCAAAAAAAGYPQRPAHVEFSQKQFTDPKSPGAASMLRDLQRGGQVEADHVVGDILARAQAAGRPATVLAAAYTHLKVYEANRK